MNNRETKIIEILHNWILGDQPDEENAYEVADKILSLFPDEDAVIKRLERVIRKRLEYCLKQNGLHHCKNCGLNEEDIKIIKGE